MTSTAAATRSAREKAARFRDLGLTGVVPAAPALATYLAGNVRQADVVALSGTRSGITTVTRRDTGAVIGTVTKLNGAWYPTDADKRGVGSGAAKYRQFAIGALIERAALLDVDEDEAVAARDEREADAPVDDEAAGLFATSPATQEFGDALVAREVEEAVVRRAAARDESVRDLDHQSAYSTAFSTDPFVASLVEQGEDEFAAQHANSIASVIASRRADARRAHRAAIARELVNVDGDLAEHADDSTARDVLDLWSASVDLVTVGEARARRRDEARKLVGFKANEVEREDLDLVTDYLRSNLVGVATPSDAIREVLRQYAALVRAAHGRDA